MELSSLTLGRLGTWAPGFTASGPFGLVSAVSCFTIADCSWVIPGPGSPSPLAKGLAKSLSLSVPEQRRWEPDWWRHSLGEEVGKESRLVHDLDLVVVSVRRSGRGTKSLVAPTQPWWSHGPPSCSAPWVLSRKDQCLACPPQGPHKTIQ